MGCEHRQEAGGVTAPPYRHIFSVQLTCLMSTERSDDTDSDSEQGMGWSMGYVEGWLKGWGRYGVVGVGTAVC